MPAPRPRALKVLRPVEISEINTRSRFTEGQFWTLGVGLKRYF